LKQTLLSPDSHAGLLAPPEPLPPEPLPPEPLPPEPLPPEPLPPEPLPPEPLPPEPEVVLLLEELQDTEKTMAPPKTSEVKLAATLTNLDELIRTPS